MNFMIFPKSVIKCLTVVLFIVQYLAQILVRYLKSGIIESKYHHKEIHHKDRIDFI